MSDADTATTALAGLIESLRALPQRVDDAVRIDRIRLLEELKAAAAAAQAVETAAFAASQRAAQRAAGVPAKRVGRGIPAQIALARRISPNQAARYAGWAAILTTELPNTFTALRAGRLSEWRAMLIARETVWLAREHRLLLDAELAPKLESLADNAAEREARRIACRLDPTGAVERIGRAEAERYVSLRPAPDAMVRLTALLPVAPGVATYAALKRAADTTTAVGDERGRGQIMADTLVERVTGQAVAADVPVAVSVIMGEDSLLSGGDEPAHLDGYGPIPAETARGLITRPSDAVPVWLRRLYTRPDTGQLVAMDSKQRYFTAGQRQFVSARDQFCRTPWCGAPIRQADHVRPHELGGQTEVRNARGCCAACNYAKQAPGWTTRVVDSDSAHEVETITPTGHRYRSRAPDPPGRHAA